GSGTGDLHRPARQGHGLQHEIQRQVCKAGGPIAQDLQGGAYLWQRDHPGKCQDTGRIQLRMEGAQDMEGPDLPQEEELFEHYSFTGAKGQEPLRVDKYLMNFIENATRNKIQQAAKAGNIQVNGIPVKQNYKVKAGD